MTLLDTTVTATDKIGYSILIVSLIVAGFYSAYGIQKEANKRKFKDRQR